MELWEAVRNALPGQEPLNLGSPPDSYPNKLSVTAVCELSGGNPQGAPPSLPTSAAQGRHFHPPCAKSTERGGGLWVPSTPTLPEQPSQHPNQLGRAGFAPSTWVLLLGLLEAAPTHRAGLSPAPAPSSLPHGSLVSPWGFLTPRGDCHPSCAVLGLPGSPVLQCCASRTAPAWPRPRSPLQIPLGNLAGLAADSCPFLLIPAALPSTCWDAVGMCQLLAQAPAEGDVTEPGVARPGWGGPAPTCSFSVWIPHPCLALRQKFLLCLVFVTFCVLFQPPKPRSQSRIPSCFRCHRVSADVCH